MSYIAEEVHFHTITKTSDPWKTVSSIIMTIVDEAYFEAGSNALSDQWIRHILR
jgi:hypothetical protein